MKQLSHLLFVKVEKVFPGLGAVHIALGIDRIDAPALGGGLQFGLPHGMAVDVLDEDGLRERWTVMDPGAPVAVTARSDLEEEGTVHPILWKAQHCISR